MGPLKEPMSLQVHPGNPWILVATGEDDKCGDVGVSEIEGYLMLGSL